MSFENIREGSQTPFYPARLFALKLNKPLRFIPNYITSILFMHKII